VSAVENENRQAYEDQLKLAYGDDCPPRWFSDRNQLVQHYSKESFDAVLLCNVLHEISPTKWVEPFDEHSLINQVLASDGQL